MRQQNKETAHVLQLLNTSGVKNSSIIYIWSEN